jgi:DNA-binding CsgD family transcriptional regulator
MGRREQAFLAPVVSPNRAVLRDMLYELFQAAGLLGLQYTVMAMLLDGYSLDEIGRTVGKSETTVHRAKQNALRAIKRHLAATTDVVLMPDIVADLFSRGHLVETIRHCKPGREACSGDGICKFRHYEA